MTQPTPTPRSGERSRVGTLRGYAAILGIAVLLDAAVVRLLLLPVLLRLMGRWAWYMPGWASAGGWRRPATGVTTISSSDIRGFPARRSVGDADVRRGTS